MEINADKLLDAETDDLRNVGYDLEALDAVDRQVRARSRNELAREIVDAVETAGEDGVEVLENFGLGDVVGDDSEDVEDVEDGPAAGSDVKIVVVVANPARTGLTLGDILVEPFDIVEQSVPYRPLDDYAEARELNERPGYDFNEAFSNGTLPDSDSDSDSE